MVPFFKTWLYGSSFVHDASNPYGLFVRVLYGSDLIGNMFSVSPIQMQRYLLKAFFPSSGYSKASDLIENASVFQHPLQTDSMEISLFQCPLFPMVVISVELFFSVSSARVLGRSQKCYPQSIPCHRQDDLRQLQGARSWWIDGRDSHPCEWQEAHHRQRGRFESCSQQIRECHSALRGS